MVVQTGSSGGHWAEVVRAYCEVMDEVIPYLPPAEQSVFQRLFRLSHVQESPFTKCRYEDLACAVWCVGEYRPTGSQGVADENTA